MINLLPPQTSDDIRYGRLNTKLRRQLLVVVAGLIGLVIIILGGGIYIDRQSTGLQHNVSDTTAELQKENLTKVQKDATEISGDIRVINQVLGQEIRFSDLIQGIGKVMPSGTVLGSITLSKVDGAIDLSAEATSYASASQIAVNLSDPKNQLFAKVDIININCTPDDIAYQCQATFKALFSPTTKTLYLNTGKAKS